MIYKYKTYIKEHISYLDEIDKIYPGKLELVGIPSGEYFTVKEGEYSKIRLYIYWDEEHGCYFYKDKDYDRMMDLLSIPF